MTPKEKAKEIYCKYKDALNIRDFQTTANPFAKQCALIAVDEVINSELFKWLEDEIYWQEVKQEVEKL
jgi:hypothetical protein